MTSSSMMSRTTAKLGVFGFGLVLLIIGLMAVFDPEPTLAVTSRIAFAALLGLVGLVSMVHAFRMMPEEKPKRAGHLARSARAS